MTTTTAATAHLFDDFTLNEAVVLVLGGGESGTANTYVNDLGAIEGHSPWTWSCGADLANWSAFARGEYPGRDVIWTLRESERSTGWGAGSDPVLAQRFDY